MRNIQICPSYKPAYYYGGPTMSVSKLCEELVVAGISPVVLTTTANGPTELPVQTSVVDGVEVRYFKRITKDHTHYSPDLFAALKKLIRRKNGEPMVVHIHSWWNIVSVFSCWIAKRAKVPVVLSPRGMLTQYTFGNRNAFVKRLIHTLIGKRLLAYCHIHATSEQEKKDIEGIIQPRSITVIPNFVSFPNERPKVAVRKANPALGGKELLMISLSRIEEKKGIDLFFVALSRLDVYWELTIAGTGDSEYIVLLKGIAEMLSIANQITWVGHVANEDKFELLARHNLMVLTSHNENFANTVIESLSVGTPVLVTEHVGLADYVKDNGLGWVCKLDAHIIAETLTTIWDSQELLKRMGDAAPAIIRRDYGAAALVKQYSGLYRYAVEHSDA